MSKQNIKFKKILVVDDDRMIRIAMKSMLTSLGCLVKVAENGCEALDMLEHEAFDMVFSDINMPKMDGCELAKSIRGSDHTFHTIPIIGISASDKEELQRAKAMGMTQVLPKPINILMLKQLTTNLNQKSHFSPGLI